MISLCRYEIVTNYNMLLLVFRDGTKVGTTCVVLDLEPPSLRATRPQTLSNSATDCWLALRPMIRMSRLEFLSTRKSKGSTTEQG